MYKLKAEIRDMNVKAKKLRREGMVPASIYGKDLEEPVYLQIPGSEVVQLKKKVSKGSTLTIDTGKETYDVLFKEYALSPVKEAVEHLEFQSLIAGEAMNTVGRVVIENRDRNKNIIQVQMEEIPYSAEAKYFVNDIVIDVDGLEGGTNITLADLDISKNENIKLDLPLDTIIVSIETPVVLSDEEIAELEAAQSETEVTQPEVIGEKEEADEE